MKKTMEQIILEGQVAKCRSLEELYVLWELMQQMEEDPDGKTCYPELDQRNFHIDGIVDPVHYDGTLYILKETNMRKMIQKGETMPVVSDIRGDFLSGKSPSGRVEYLEYLTGMQKVLWRNVIRGKSADLPGKSSARRRRSSISISAAERARPMRSAWIMVSTIWSLSRSRSGF